MHRLPAEFCFEYLVSARYRISGFQVYWIFSIWLSGKFAIWHTLTHLLRQHPADSSSPATSSWLIFYTRSQLPYLLHQYLLSSYWDGNRHWGREEGKVSGDTKKEIYSALSNIIRITLKYHTTSCSCWIQKLVWLS